MILVALCRRQLGLVIFNKNGRRIRYDENAFKLTLKLAVFRAVGRSDWQLCCDF